MGVICSSKPKDIEPLSPNMKVENEGFVCHAKPLINPKSTSNYMA
jgi:hypothetical protein